MVTRGLVAAWSARCGRGTLSLGTLSSSAVSWTRTFQGGRVGEGRRLGARGRPAHHPGPLVSCRRPCSARGVISRPPWASLPVSFSFYRSSGQRGQEEVDAQSGPGLRQSTGLQKRRRGRGAGAQTPAGFSAGGGRRGATPKPRGLLGLLVGRGAGAQLPGDNEGLFGSNVPHGDGKRNPAAVHGPPADPRNSGQRAPCHAGGAAAQR